MPTTPVNFALTWLEFADKHASGLAITLIILALIGVVAITEWRDK